MVVCHGPAQLKPKDFAVDYTSTGHLAGQLERNNMRRWYKDIYSEVL
jgi:hypothetical protein